MSSYFHHNIFDSLLFVRHNSLIFLFICCRPEFIRIGDFYITYTNFKNSVKPRAQMCNETMSLCIESFNIDHVSSTHLVKKFSFPVLTSVSSHHFINSYSHHSSPAINFYTPFFIFNCATAPASSASRTVRPKRLRKRAEEGVPKLSDFNI